MRYLLPLLLSVLGLAGACSSSQKKVTISRPIYYVVPDELKIWAAPTTESKVLGTLNFDAQVEVLEFSNDRAWARVSEYIDGKDLGLPGRVARWLPMADLSSKRRVPKLINVIKVDPRILYVPSEENSGLTREQIVVLLKASQLFIDNGTCGSVDLMDYNNGKWFVSCTGSNQYKYFNPRDLGIKYP